MFVILNLSAEEKEPEWIKAAEIEGISVYTREVPDSKIQEVRAEAMLKAAPSKIWKVILDYENYKDFMPFTKESEITHKEKDIIYFYTRLQFGWGIGDRYYTIKIENKENPEEKIAYKSNWDLAEKYTKAPTEPTAIGVPINKGYWELINEDGEKTKVIYYLYTNPGGEVPAIIANFANKDALPKIIKAVSQRVKDKKHDEL